MIAPEILGGLVNAIRGGQWFIWFGMNEAAADVFKKKYFWLKCDYINALIFGGAIYYTSSDWALALLSIGTMLAGATPGFGDYIGAVGGWRTDNLQENRFIDPLISRLKRWPQIWGWAGLSLRGLWWGVCLAAPFWWFGRNDVALDFLCNGLFMAPAYWAAIEWMDSRVQRRGEGWGLGEIFYGAILWSALGGVK